MKSCCLAAGRRRLSIGRVDSRLSCRGCRPKDLLKIRDFRHQPSRRIVNQGNASKKFIRQHALAQEPLQIKQ
ncbi:hypothetical protein DBR47_00630 [Paucibacter sp. KBW04]|nr:hypothetical protein DBR47_00630 [Paucibacter sp. KBW04]